MLYFKNGNYVSPTATTIQVKMNTIICLSLTGGTEPMNQSDLEDPIFDDPFIL